MISSIPSTHANTVAPYAPLGRQPVGQESSDLKSSSFKALEQSASSARSENRRSPEDRPNEQGELDRVSGGQNRAVQGRDQQSEKDAENNKEQLAKQQKQIDELVTIDREVHAHEQAHAAVGGEYAGSPTYQFVRGPDGVSYAVGGEVSISTSPIPDDPQATIRKAQQIRQAANAPADPSPQDRRVAAAAASLEAEARAQLAQQQAAESQQNVQLADEKAKAQKAEEKQRLADEAESQKEAARQEEARQVSAQRSSLERATIFEKTAKTTFDISRHLVDIGVVKGFSSKGVFLNSKV